ncbi:MAG TPA: alkaline phosphatase family protein, partial [Vicinamibacterales bacterium]
MRTALVACLALAAIASTSCARPPAESGRPKLVILGFDGLDPDLVRQYIDAGQMPTFKRLMTRGGLYPLETTVSPESPTAWASFATG